MEFSLHLTILHIYCVLTVPIIVGGDFTIEKMWIYSWLLRSSTARGFSTGLVPVGTAKVKVHKSILFNQGTRELREVKIKNTCWHTLFYLTLLLCSMQWQSVTFNFVKTVTEMVTGCLRTINSCHFCIRWLKVFLVNYGKYGTLFIYVCSELETQYNLFFIILCSTCLRPHSHSMRQWKTSLTQSDRQSEC